jgi:hypothetical protein
MGVFRKMVYVLIILLVSTLLWVGASIYINYNSVELKADLLGSENIYQFLSKGMLDEVNIVIEDTDGLPVQDSAPDLLDPIEPYFNKIGFEKVLEKIEEKLIVPPSEFHDLRNDAVMKETSPLDDQLR